MILPTLVLLSCLAAEPSAAMQKLLARKVNVSEERITLQEAVEQLQKQVSEGAAEVEPTIVILGKDLEISGITRNQILKDMRWKDQSLSDVLNDVVRKANPATDAKDLADERQQLVWVIGPNPAQPKREVILITTRRAAKDRELELRPPFVK